MNFEQRRGMAENAPVGGEAYVGCGILLFPLAIFLPSDAAGTVLFVLSIGSSLIVTLASYLWWRKLE